MLRDKKIQLNKITQKDIFYHLNNLILIRMRSVILSAKVLFFKLLKKKGMLQGTTIFH